MTKKVHSLAARQAAARTAVTASKKTGRPVDPRVQALAEQPTIPVRGRRSSPAVRQAAAKAAVTASKKSGRPVHPRVEQFALPCPQLNG